MWPVMNQSAELKWVWLVKCILRNHDHIDSELLWMIWNKFVQKLNWLFLYFWNDPFDLIQLYDPPFKIFIPEIRPYSYLYNILILFKKRGVQFYGKSKNYETVFWSRVSSNRLHCNTLLYCHTVWSKQITVQHLTYQMYWCRVDFWNFWNWQQPKAWVNDRLMMFYWLNLKHQVNIEVSQTVIN